MLTARRMRERERQTSPAPVNPTTLPWAAHELAIQELTKANEADKASLRRRLATLEADASKRELDPGAQEKHEAEVLELRKRIEELEVDAKSKAEAHEAEAAQLRKRIEELEELATQPSEQLQAEAPETPAEEPKTEKTEPQKRKR